MIRRIRSLSATTLRTVGFCTLSSIAFATAAQATEVRDVAVRAQEGRTTVTIAARGPIEVHDFVLDSPPRLVLDLGDATLGSRPTSLEVQDEIVRGIRCSQFALDPRPVTRVVIDLWDARPYRIDRDDAGLRISLGPDAPPAPPGATDGADGGGGAPVMDPELALEPAPDSADASAEVAGGVPGGAPTPPVPAPVVAVAGDEVASITYMTLSTVYVSAGTDDGLRAGDELEVVRDGSALGHLRVQEVSRHRAACALVDRTAEFVVGDRIALGNTTGSPASTVPAASLLHRNAPTETSPRRSTSSGEGWLRAHGLRGRVGARYLSVQDRTGEGQSFSQPALDLRVEGRRIGDAPFDASVDVRTRRTYRSMPDGESSQDGRSRVYRANAAWTPFAGRFALTAGRQYSIDLPALGIFDGASAVLRSARWSFGLLSGTQPDEQTFGYSSDVREHGGFLQARSASGATNAWSATLGVVASYAQGEINREYAVLQTTGTWGRVSTYVSQDVDLNRGWKRETEGETLSLTNTFSTLRLQASRSTVLSSGYDNRRNVRLYRDYVSPEVEFDDTYRQGIWAGIDQRLGNRARLAVQVKRSTGGSTERADSYTLNGSVQWPVALRARSTWFTNALVEGWIHSGSASVQLGPGVRVEVGGGTRRQTSRTPGGEDEDLHWTNAVVDYAVGRSWYASVSFERSDDGPQANDQVYGTLSYRF